MQSRRQFLATSVITAATLPLLRGVARAAEDDDCIDAHVHVWTPDIQRFPLAKGYTRADMVPPSFTPEELFAHCRPVGVSKIVLIQMSFYGFDNSYMLSVMEKHPGVFSGVAIIDETQNDAPQKMKTLAAKGVRGFRLYADQEKTSAWSNSAGMKQMWSTAAETGQAMCLLANPDALPNIQRMIEQYPKTRVVIDHFARIGMSGRIDSSELDNLCRLASFDNVYVKTSAFYALGTKKPPYTDLVPMIERLLKEYSAERLMWASDCPYQVQGEHTYAASINLIREHMPDLSPAQKRSLLRDTAQKVFFA